MLFDDKTASFYFIGIGGVSMSALARLLKRSGHAVRGSDMQESDFTKLLLSEGIPVSIGEEEEIEEDVVVYTGAISPAHPQMLAAQKKGKILLARPRLLGLIAESFPHVISVAGCHGKTTTSSMLAHIFLKSGRPFTCHIGGEDLVLGNFYSSGGEYFLTEACEFQRSFLNLKSEIAIILNCDLDHTDCYKSEEELFSAYEEFAALSKKIVVNADDRQARTLPYSLSFGLYGGEVRAENLTSFSEKYSFTITERGIPIVKVSLNCVGKVMVLDALAAFAAARLLGFSAEEIKAGLESFRGVSRRFEHVGTILGVPVVCDYAHHPREIKAMLSTAKKICRGRVHLVFQPHTYTRTRDFMEEFQEVLSKAERPILYKTYAAREKFDARGSAYLLASKIAGAVYVQSPLQLLRRLKEEIHEEDLILCLGAGDIFYVVKSILDGQ